MCVESDGGTLYRTKGSAIKCGLTGQHLSCMLQMVCYSILNLKKKIEYCAMFFLNKTEWVCACFLHCTQGMLLFEEMLLL